MTMKILSGPETVQGSPEWLNWRTKGIGASDAPIIMGKSLYTRAYELFRFKTGRGSDPKRNPILEKIRERGKKMEPLAREAFERDTNTIITPIVAESATHPFIRASFDGLDGFTGIPTEIKCPGQRAHNLAIAGKVPDEYVDQLQHQMFVAESDKAYYYSFDGTNGVLLEVLRDQTRIDQILAAEISFWNRVQHCIWETDEWAAAATMWLLAKKELDEVKAREEISRKALSELMNGPEKTKEGCGVILTKTKKKGSVDIKALLLDHGISIPDDEIDKYRQSSSEVIQIRVSAGIDLEQIDPAPLSMTFPWQDDTQPRSLNHYPEVPDMIL